MFGATIEKVQFYTPWALVLVHVAEHFLHGRVADGSLEENVLHPGGGHVAQKGQHQQQPAEPGWLGGMLRSGVLP